MAALKRWMKRDVGAGVLQALAHVRQGGLRLRQVRHNVEELAHADAPHRLIHIVL